MATIEFVWPQIFCQENKSCSFLRIIGMQKLRPVRQKIIKLWLFLNVRLFPLLRGCEDPFYFFEKEMAIMCFPMPSRKVFSLIILAGVACFGSLRYLENQVGICYVSEPNK